MKKLTIAIPCIPSRLDHFTVLCKKIQQQIKNDDVEIISIIDNKSMSVGRKRQALFQLAQGMYVCQIDDDDDVSEDFIDEILKAIHETDGNAEVITYHQECDIDGEKLFVFSGIDYPTNDSVQGLNPQTNRKEMYRFPWHWNCWRNDIAKRGQFYDCNGVEDTVFPRQMKEIIKTEYTINKFLVKYIFKTNATASPAYVVNESNTPKLCNLKVIE